MLTVLHVLPHWGGGAETYIDALERMPDVTHRRIALSDSRTPAGAATSIPRRFPAAARAARAADLVQVHGDTAAIIALPLRPQVIATQGLHLLRRARGAAGVAARAGMTAAVAAARVVACSSEAERAELRALLPARLHGRLALVPSGVEPVPEHPERRRAARAALGLADGDVAGLYLGQLEPRKDPLVAVRAAQLAGPPLVLLVAGAGPLEAAVRVQAGSNVRVLGFRDDPETLLAASDIFVLPSHREGLSFALLEAMSHGLAPVVADGPGNPEGVGDAGRVVPVGDVEAFAAALAELASDHALCAAVGAAARTRVSERYTGDLLRERTLAVYRRAQGA